MSPVTPHDTGQTTTPSIAPSRCPACGRAIEENYCARCGELRPEKRDYSVRHFFGQAIETFTSVDTRLSRTVSTLVRTPGKLTADFMSGLRHPFVQPLQLFLLTNVVFFLMNSVTGYNTFTTPLFTHLYRLPYSSLARAVALPYVAGRDIPLSEYAQRFDDAAALQARSLIIIMVPIFSMFVVAAYRRARRYYVEHLVFSLHLYAFLLLTLSVLQLVSILTVSALRGAGYRPSAGSIDATLTFILVVVIGIYLYRALRRLYDEGRLVVLMKSAVLIVAVGVTLQVYRFVLFFVTLYTT